MVNNFTNINKTNNHLSPKLIVHKKIMTYDVGDASLGLGQARKSGGIKPVNGIPISNHKVEIMFSNCNTHLLNSPKILSKELYAAKFVLRQVPILYRGLPFLQLYMFS
jgi:hypothetical protein